MKGNRKTDCQKSQGKKLMDMTKGAENPNKQKHEKPHNKLLCVTVCQEKKEVGE